jgi:hypothetical protein
LAVTNGAPEHLASGWIYGIPDNYPNQIPSHWYTNMGFKNGKGGGAQLSTGGWISGLSAYKVRFQSTLDNYKTCVAVGADFHIYVHDLWGTDHATSSTAWPGDNSDWSDYTKFVQQLMSDVAANMDPAHVTWDIWNEPDISVFWVRSSAQWVQLFTKTYALLRANSALSAMKISGPSLAYRPSSSNTWWTSWLSAIKSANAVPDYYTYHLEGGTGASDSDPQVTNGTLAALLSQYGLPVRQTFINEYAAQAEMLPSGYAWWIARLERYDFLGMLGNWLGGTELHDLFAQLLTKPDYSTYSATDYEAAPGYPVYQYYNLNMTGQRVQTTGSSDKWLDAYATRDSSKVRVLAGTRTHTGTWNLVIEGLSSVGYSSGSVSVTTYTFGGSSTTAAVTGQPAVQGTSSHTISNGAITISISQTDSHTAWAFEFAVQGGSSSPSTTTSLAARSTMTTTATTTSTGPVTQAPTTTPASGSGGSQTEWGQCGGIGWSGPTGCQTPYTCSSLNPYYSQCL